MVTYPVMDKRLKGPAVLTWEVGQTPSERELKEQIEQLVEQENKPKVSAEEVRNSEESEQPQAKKTRANRAQVMERRAARKSVNVHAEAARALRSMENERPSRRRIRH